MFYAAVEMDSGEILKVQYPDGRIGGKPILSFLMGLSGYCSKSEGIDLSWFAKLEADPEETLCSLGQPILQSSYSGDWDYQEDEYEFFQHRSPDMPISEEDFKTIVRQVKEKWMDLDKLIRSVRKVAQLLRDLDLEASPWYEPNETINDFEALLRTLAIASERGVNRVRIKFT